MTTELKERSKAALDSTRELNGKAARQVSDILEQSRRNERTAKPAVAYRIPFAGVRYYF